MTLNAVRHASTFEEVSKEEQCLLVKYRPGIGLQNYNLEKLRGVEAQLGEEALASAIKTFTDHLPHLFSVLANHSPRLMLVISVADGWKGFDHVFSYIEDVPNPPEALILEIRARDAALREEFRRVEQFLESPGPGGIG